MLTLDLLADNHRRIYEAVRDADRPVSPSEIEELTGIEGSNLRSTLSTMVKKGLLVRPIYGTYTVVPLSEVGGVGNLPRREYVTEKTPTGESSKPRIGTPGSGMYNPESVRIITQNTEEDMTYDPSWVVPMLLSAYAAVMNRDDLERARLFKETGKRFRVRLTVEEDDPRTSEEPPPSKG